MKLFCTDCGLGEGNCECGKQYSPMKAGVAAALAIKAHPELSDLQLAKLARISSNTVWRYRANRAAHFENRAARKSSSPHRANRAPPPEPQIDPATLSLTAQAKLDAAIRQHQKRLNETFEDRVQKEIDRRIEKLVLPAHQEEQEEAQLLRECRRDGIFSKAEFNAILMCLHRDRLKAVGEKELDHACNLFLRKKIALLSNKDDPRKYPPLPSLADFVRG